MYMSIWLQLCMVSCAILMPWRPEEGTEAEPMSGSCGQLWTTVWVLGAEPGSSKLLSHFSNSSG